MNIHVEFEYGVTWVGGEMKPKTIYLDGSCRGPHIVNDGQSYSFDHHHDCIRFATLSSCEQTLLALDLGLNPDGFTVVLNDLDADGSMSLWLLRNPDAIDDRVREQVRLIGFVDSHGPVRPATKLHKVLTRNPREAQTIEMLWEDQAHIDAWREGGDEALPEPFSFPPVEMHGVDKDGEVVEVVGDFATAYAAGAIMALAKVPGPDGTVGWTVGKRSDFAKGDIPGFLAAMNELEPGWGGGSTIGGAPRLEGGLRSSLRWSIVWPIFYRFAT